MTEEKLNKIEEILAHQERQIETLSRTAAQQFDMIDMLKKRVDFLQKTLTQLSADGLTESDSLSAIPQSPDEKPPHY